LAELPQYKTHANTPLLSVSWFLRLFIAFLIRKQANADDNFVGLRVTTYKDVSSVYGAIKLLTLT
jgi:hypothetical protein